MAERRALIDGLRPASERVVEEAFVFGKPADTAPNPLPASPAVVRVKLTTQVRADLEAAGVFDKAEKHKLNVPTVPPSALASSLPSPSSHPSCGLPDAVGVP